VKLLNDDELLTVVAIHTVSGKQLLYAQVNSSFGTETQRSFQYDGKKYEFKGNYYITEISK
jgi:hypothetical protein